MDTFRKRAGAKQCREHRWLARKAANHNHNHNLTSRMNKVKPTSPEPVASTSTAGLELDVTKDNLRLFVERWREHPDSPYTIDNAPLERQSSQETVSLRGQSPSPCGSICSNSSSLDSQSPDGPGVLLAVPDLAWALERRASEGRGLLDKHKIDPASQILLAEEIIRLSEHLRSIAVGPVKPARTEEADKTKVKKNGTTEKVKGKGKVPMKATLPKEAENDVNEISEKLSNITKQRKLNGTTFNGSRNLDKYSSTNDSNSSTNLFTFKRSSKTNSNDASSSTTAISSSSSESSPNKSKLNNGRAKDPEEDSRPRTREIDLTPPWRQGRILRRFGETCRDVPRIATLQDLHKTMNLDEPTSTKNLLLKLIDEWGDIRRPSGMGGRKSISMDWCGEESVARKSINSLAEYFQSEQQKVTTAPSSTSHSASIHR